MGKHKHGTSNNKGVSKKTIHGRQSKDSSYGKSKSDMATIVSSNTSEPEDNEIAASSSHDGFSSGLASASDEPIPSGLSFEVLKGKINSQVLNTIINDLKFQHQTPIQAATIEPLLGTVDMLAQARTGTGKTMAFLVPAIDKLLRAEPVSVSVLILSPTRELVIQTAAEAKRLLSTFPQIKVRTAIGGTNKDKEGEQIYSGCHILVATPGRLLDHLSDEHMRYQLSFVKTLVLDEADRMLDMGFLPDIKRILAHIPPKEKRQSMLFSATIPDSIISIAKTILKPDYLTISTIPEGEGNMHKRVKQYLLTIRTMNDVAPTLVSVVASELSNAQEFKAIIFTPTAVLSDFYSHILEHKYGATIPILTMHSRMSQPKRTAATNIFRNSKHAICIATDVIARGMDFPLVTHVIQAGLPMSRESYIHRLGRTARADADGVGILILAEAEKSFLRDIKDVNFSEYNAQVAPSAIQDALDTLDEEKKAKIYQGWLGYYKAMKKYTRWSNEDLVAEANRYALDGLDCPEIPELETAIVNKMGLRGTKGLRVGQNKPRRGGRNSRGEQGSRNGNTRRSGVIKDEMHS
ncbi:uncharacterized protein PV09_08116 [Verruconis gallopava]|uniref:ATP-dependent RNA helicase n=1 Tax=Verruconis gallopava TaxID=253628 RepID=A0A0D2AMR1_9PEZI|nr:uncharacterized protein PV09_08116 [Verruconis gallopava]KIW00409.1 hypothetical protein PV09_08116 [Verruconis gallopava]